jgi:hypothetical protein
VVAVAAAVGVVAILLHLAGPVIDNTLSSFPTPETMDAFVNEADL